MAKRLATELSTQNPPVVSYLSDQEEELIQLCRKGDRDSQRQLYEQHCEKVYRLMFRMVGFSNADDLTQQVFLCLFQNLDKFQGRSSLATWLYSLATNEALQFLRRQRRDGDQLILGDPPDEHKNANAALDERDLLEWALGRLDPDLRAILLLREIEELSYYDIALTLDIAEGTVASRLNRSRRALRELIENATGLR